jgi:hypothetical protein
MSAARAELDDDATIPNDQPIQRVTRYPEVFGIIVGWRQGDLNAAGFRTRVGGDR